MKIATTVFSMPNRIVSNEEVLEIIRRQSAHDYQGDLDHDLAIIRRFLLGSGLRERRWCKDGESPRDHIIHAVEGALDESGLSKNEVELVSHVRWNRQRLCRGFNIRDSCARNGGLGPLGGDCPYDVVFAVKVGAMYRALPWLTVGATYTSPVRFNYTNGQATLNFSAFGLGTVNYDARVAGIKWPQQVDVSMAAKPIEHFTVALTTSWINWATINTVEITATNPNNALAPAQVNLNIPFNWKDQVVIALGFSYSVMQESSWKDKDRLVLRAGYNYSNNPIPKETLSPLWPLINEHHFSVGFGFRFTERWTYGFSGLYALKNSVTYTNPSLPFGPNATESTSGYDIYNTISYRF